MVDNEINTDLYQNYPNAYTYKNKLYYHPPDDAIMINIYDLTNNDKKPKYITNNQGYLIEYPAGILTDLKLPNPVIKHFKLIFINGYIVSSQEVFNLETKGNYSPSEIKKAINIIKKYWGLEYIYTDYYKKPGDIRYNTAAKHLQQQFESILGRV